MKIRVRNYQSLADVTVEPEGLTIVTGKSNLGKSALIRAVRAAFFGHLGDHFIRENETFCGVHVEDTGLDLTWRKVPKPTVDKQSALSVNGATHTKLGREHGSLTKDTGVYELTTSTKDNFTPQFALQFDHPFLIRESETVVAELLRMLGRTDVVTNAQAAAKKDRTNTESKRKVRGPDRDEAKKRLAELDHVPATRIALNTLQKLILEAEQRNDRRMLARVNLTRYLQLKPQRIPDPPSPPSAAKVQTLTQLRRYLQLRPQKVPDEPTFSRLEIDVRQAQLRLLRALQEAQRELAMIAEEKEQVDTRIRQTLALKADLEQELGMCPACERPFQSETHDH